MKRPKRKFRRNLYAVVLCIQALYCKIGKSQAEISVVLTAIDSEAERKNPDQRARKNFSKGKNIFQIVNTEQFSITPQQEIQPRDWYSRDGKRFRSSQSCLCYFEERGCGG